MGEENSPWGEAPSPWREPLSSGHGANLPSQAHPAAVQERTKAGRAEPTEVALWDQEGGVSSGLTPTPAPQAEPGAEPGHFGVCVGSLTSDKASVPIVLEKLLEHVEMHGLYTEGLYRKSGAANRTRELRQALQTGGLCGQVAQGWAPPSVHL